MQQTEKYKFNLIETSDTFSPEALNANAEAVEAELAALAGADAAIRAEVGAGSKNCRIAYGEHTGDGASSVTLTFDFKPLIVFVNIGTTMAVLIHGATGNFFVISQNSLIKAVAWGENGVTLSNESANLSFNHVGGFYRYVAIGESF